MRVTILITILLFTICKIHMSNKILKAYILIVVCMLFHYSTLSQFINIELKNVFNTYIPNEEEILISNFGKELSYTRQITSMKHTIYTIQNDTIKTTNLTMPKQCVGNSIKDFVITDNSVYVLYYNALYVFKISKQNNKFNYVASINCTFQNMKYVNGILYLYSAYNYRKSDMKKSKNICIASFDKQNYKLKTELNFDLKHIYFTHFPGNAIEMSNRNVFINHFYPYHIDIYNNIFQKIYTLHDSFQAQPLYNEEFMYIDSLNKSENRNTKELMKLTKKLDKKLKRLIKVISLNDTLMMVVKKDTNINEESRIIDVWNVQKEPKQIVTNQYFSQENFDINIDSTFKIPFMFINSSPILTFNNYLIQKDVWLPFYFEKLSLNEFRNRAEHYFKSNPIYHSIHIFKWEIK